MDISTAGELWDATPGWLNTASYGLPPRHAFEELQTVLDQWRHGSSDWKPWDASVARSRAAFARMIGADPADVSVSSTVSQIMSVVATALPPGARVVVPEIEFTSNLFPWAVAAEVVTVPAERLAEAITPDTDAVAFSLVQSATGYITPRKDVVEAARAHDALVIADASQACGWLPVDVEGLDALACAAYKWLMAPRGAAFGYLSPRLRERMRPLAANWYGGADEGGSYYGPPLRLADDARAFDLSPAWFSFVGAAPAIELLNELGVERIREHNVGLANRFTAGLGLEPSGSAIVSVDAPGERLEAAGIRAAVRAGRVRASFHVYTTTDDVDRAVEALTQGSPRR
ncbi:aminotransferase class V-fold PLP-dependent enzyme [Nonomuraea sp. NPDC046802]|uniref:aminotransferase class V-fold PLP-dependent enzyme n=1 Tax=Nonomuraea sp. NPDC046802 TaxID=3154919 RepID=UPI0034007221